MAPARGRDPSVERTDEYEEFMADLEKYHELRGTVLEREPKIANRHLDLFRLYKKVTEEGGYDRVSDTKSNKLAWRRIAADFLQSNPQQLMTQAFLVKTVYYKNLAAYEIAKFHGKEPPPKEILEDLTAKGGNLMSRTVENFQAPRRLTNGNGDGSEASDDEKSRTPGEKMDVDEPSSGRATRGLRHAPPQRVLFQPDTSTARQTRQVSHKSSTPPVGHVGTPGSSSHTLDQGHRSHSYGQSHSYAQANGVPISNIANLNMAGFDPTQNIPSTVRPVPTPSNNSSYFRQLKDKILASRNINKDTMMYPRGFVPPGMGFPGPGIYQRCVMALRSGVRTEQEWALHHLVRMSNERGDKFVLHQFPNLAEALLEKVLEMTPLFYDTEPWEISYINTSGFLRPNELDGINGTADLLDKLAKLSLRQTPADTLYTREFSHDLERINEAALILRNMIMHPDNARYLSNIVFVKDVITIALNLPKTPIVIELKNYCLEMAEQLMQFFILGARDPLYVSLVAQLQSEDRGVIIAALNSLARNGLNYEATNRLENVPLSALTRINNWLLIEDEQLNGACLDFLYMYTAVTENVEIMVQSVDMHALISSMVRLLMFRAKFEEQSERVRVPPTPSSIPRAPPKLSSSILNQLAKEAEPERSSHWLRTSYMEQEGAETTQVDLWTAYNSAFQSFGDTLPAKNFITNTTATFPIANAQMSQTQFGHSKYVVQNLRPRDVAIDLRGRPYPRCLWHISADGTECGEFSLDPQGLWEHILKTHLPVKKDENDKWTIDDNPEDAKAKTFTCRWGGCLHFASQSDVEPTLVSRHIQTHLPDTSPDAAKRRQHNRDTKDEDLPKAPPKTWISTQTDARNEAEGLPLTSAFVLRNLARQLAKVDRNMRNGENQEKRDLVANYFSPFKEQLFYVFAYNRALVPWLERLLDVIATDAGWF